MPRSVTATVSKYQRARVWRGDFVRGEVFTLGINLTGALADGDTIDTITWRVLQPQSVILGVVDFDARTASVVCTAGVGPGSVVKAIVTTPAGAVWTQLFRVYVTGDPWFSGETAPAAGATEVTA